MNGTSFGIFPGRRFKVICLDKDESRATANVNSVQAQIGERRDHVRLDADLLGANRTRIEKRSCTAICRHEYILGTN